MENGSFLVGDWRVDPQANLLTRNGSAVRLEPKMMSVLLLLAENAGQVVSKEKLLDVVWKDVFVSEQALKVTISELRKALADDARNPRFINTIPKKGYQLIAEVKPVTAAAEPQRAAKVGAPKFVWILALAALTAILSIALVFFSPRSGDVSVRSFNSIAVLPLRDISRPPAEEFFSEGLTESVTANLAKGQLKVISPRSTLSYKNSDKKAAQIAAELNVETLLEGTILRSGEKVRLSVNLLEGKTGEILWTKTYEQNLSDIFEMQADFSADIAQQINLKLVPSSARNRRVNPEAYDNYLKGRFFWNKRKPDAMLRSLEFYQKAVEIEPDNGLYYSGIADTNILLAFYSPNGSEEYYQKAQAAARKAIELDYSLAEAHISLAGILHKYELDWAGAESEFQTAIELNPSYPTAHHWYALYLMSKGDHARALAEINRALDLDPFSLVLRGDRGWILYVAGRYDEAIAEMKILNEMEGGHLGSYLLIVAYCKKGMFNEAITLANQVLSKFEGKPNYVSLLAYAQALSGRRAEALENLEKLKTMSPEQLSAFQLAIVYSALGDREQALDHLEKVVENRSSWQPFLHNEPLLEPLRNEPRFQKLVQKLGF
jgi:TolB-like protein/DNA-binding winged helix-turn-helix (wHTH) protein/Flp pilus assembly protein TadD